MWLPCTPNLSNGPLLEISDLKQAHWKGPYSGHVSCIQKSHRLSWLISAYLIHFQSKTAYIKPYLSCKLINAAVLSSSCGPLTWHSYKSTMHTHHCCVGGWVMWRCGCRGWAGLLSHVRSPWNDRWSVGGHVSGHSLHWHHAGSSSSVLPPLETLGPDCCFSRQKHTYHCALFSQGQRIIFDQGALQMLCTLLLCTVNTTVQLIKSVKYEKHMLHTTTWDRFHMLNS